MTQLHIQTATSPSVTTALITAYEDGWTSHTIVKFSHETGEVSSQTVCEDNIEGI